MTTHILLLALFLLGVGVGTNIGIQWERRHPNMIGVEKQPELQSHSIQEALENYWKAVEEGWELMYPPHDADCECAICEIEHGPVKDRPSVTKQVVASLKDHPDYIEAMKQRVASLKEAVASLKKANQEAIIQLRDRDQRIKNLQEMVDQRDRDRAQQVTKAYKAGLDGDDMIVDYSGEISRFVCPPWFQRPCYMTGDGE